MEGSGPARLGFLVPPANWTVESEVRAFLPDGVSIHFNRLSRVDETNEGEGRKRVTADNLNVMAASVGRAARDMAEASPDVIVYCCTSGSFVNGWAGHADLSDRITRQTGIPAITTSTAVLSALQAVKARKVVMVAPYPQEIIDIEIDFFAHFGIEIVTARQIECPTDDDIRAVPAATTAAAVCEAVAGAGAFDAVFVSCTNLRIMPEIARLETVLQKPVVTSNQASLWAALNIVGRSPAAHAGRLSRIVCRRSDPLRLEML